MRILLYRLVETDDSLEMGEALGEIEVGEGTVEVRMEDAGVRERLQDVLSSPLDLRGAAPGTLGTASHRLAPGDPGYEHALAERLQGRDLRLFAQPLP